MNRKPALAFILTVIFLAAFLISPALCQEEKIGVVDIVRVIDQTKQGKKATAEMAARLKSAEEDLRRRESEIVKMKDTIEKNAMVLSAETLAQKERQYQDKLIEYQRKQQEYQNDLSIKNEETNTAMMTLIKEAIDKIGNEGYILILEKTASGVLYAIDTVDLTDRVIEQLNKN